MVDKDKKEYKEAFEKIAKSEYFMEYLQKLFDQELLSLISSTPETFQKKQGRVTMLKEIMELFTKK